MVAVETQRIRSKTHNPEKLASSFAEVGQINPITLTTELRLITGYHRLEAAKALEWEHIEARVVEVDDLEAELLEIDENLRRYDLTAWEQSQHIERRENLLKKRGERATANDNRHTSRGDTVSPLKTNSDLAAEVGMSERTYQRRSKVGRDIASATADILNSITDLEACDLPDSPKQLEYLAKLEDKTLQATIAERVAHGAAKDVFEASKQLKREKRDAELEQG